MKNKFQKLFRRDHDLVVTTSPQVIPMTSNNVYDHQKQALIGWIANRMGQRIQLDMTSCGALIYQALSENKGDERSSEPSDVLLGLARCLVDWIIQDKDVYLQMKELHIPDLYYQSFLDTYEELKESHDVYLPYKRQVAIVDDADESEIWDAYRDVIFACTEGKLMLIRKGEIEHYKQGTRLCEASIKERADIPKAREAAKLSLIQNGTPPNLMTMRLLVISEAITNILKHANEGYMTIVESESRIQVIVEDTGPGIPLKLLPNTTLMAGYSTKKSLGQGFTLMRKMADQVMLSTSPNGTSIILIFNRKQVSFDDTKE